MLFTISSRTLFPSPWPCWRHATQARQIPKTRSVYRRVLSQSSAVNSCKAPFPVGFEPTTGQCPAKTNYREALLLVPSLADFHPAASSHNAWRDFGVPSGVRSQCPESLWSSACRSVRESLGLLSRDDNRPACCKVFVSDPLNAIAKGLIRRCDL